MSFAAPGFVIPLVRAAAEQGSKCPRPFRLRPSQRCCVGATWALSQTGSGKTGAFALPLLDQIVQVRRGAAKRLHGLHTLVLVPTRELAQQVGEVFRALAQGLPGACKVVVAYGGVSINPQMMALRGGADVVVATRAGCSICGAQRPELGASPHPGTLMRPTVCWTSALPMS